MCAMMTVLRKCRSLVETHSKSEVKSDEVKECYELLNGAEGYEAQKYKEI
jgi:hypothetical protein